MSSGLRAAATRSNLRLAWLWTRTNTERAYREYSGPLWRAYSLAIDSRLEALRTSLLDGTYAPEHSTKLFLPKKSGVQRPYTILSVNDQIVYQALSNVIAERLITRVGNRYNRSVFGNLYAGRNSPFFYKSWTRSYGLYTKAMTSAYHSGYVYTASFDLTACYDSIDHAVLQHSLRQLRLDADFVSLLLSYLSHWTEYSGGISPVYHGHGIPQGPLPSGLIAETVLRHFDEADGRKNLRYFRYVDDIRLFAKDERSLRQELVALDIRSKQLGLFPQASKIDIHRITNIADEFKSVSLSAHKSSVKVANTPAEIEKELVALSSRYVVQNSTRFRFLLGSAPLTSKLALRLIRIVDGEPSMYESAFRFLARFPRITEKTSRALLALLPRHDVYPAFAAALLRATRENLHANLRPDAHAYCTSRLYGNKSTNNPELRVAATAFLARDGAISWKLLRPTTRWKNSWWCRALVLPYIQEATYGRPSYQSMIHDALKDSVADVALVAAELVVVGKLDRPAKLSSVNRAAQQVLKEFGVIGRQTKPKCEIAPIVSHVLGVSLRGSDWRPMLDKQRYRHLTTRFAVWKGYADTDPTAWVALTDTINDILLSRLHPHDGSIGGYNIGNIGGALHTPTSAFAKAYPRLYEPPKL